MTEQYKPSHEEVKKAKGMMTPKQKEMSRERVDWLKLKEKDEEKRKNFLKNLREKLGISAEKEIPIYNVEIGGLSHDQVKKELKSKHMKDVDDEMLDQTAFKSEKQTIEVVQLSALDLGFETVAPISEVIDKIFAKGRDLDLGLCLPETGPIFQLQYPSNKKDMIVGMNPIYYNDDKKTEVYMLGKMLSHINFYREITPNTNFIFRLDITSF